VDGVEPGTPIEDDVRLLGDDAVASHPYYIPRLEPSRVRSVPDPTAGTASRSGFAPTAPGRTPTDHLTST
jgi:hypothetical protein